MSVEQNKLPAGWYQCNIDKIISVDGLFCDGDWVESKDQDHSGEVRLIQLADIGDGCFINKSNRRLTKNKALQLNCSFLKKGDILVARMPDPLGRACIFPLQGIDKYVTVVDVCVIRPESKDILDKFLMYVLNSPKVRAEIETYKKGSTRKRISRKNLAKVTVYIPPLNEQKRIVAKIEELFSKLDKGVESFKASSEQLNAYRETVLKNAFEGKLIVKKQPLELKKIGDICKYIVPNRDKPKSFSGSIPWVTTPDLSYNRIKINYSDIRKGLSKDETAKYKAKIIPIDSVIMTCVGNFGITAIVEKELVINQQLHAFLPSEKFIPKYLAYALKSKKNYMYELSTSVTVSYLNKSNCNSIPIPLMSLKEQQEIVEEIESRFSVIDKLEKAIETNLQTIKTLRQSILKKAFSGQLVEQDPTDEPASILLDRIKSERKARQFKSLKVKSKKKELI